MRPLGKPQGAGLGVHPQRALGADQALQGGGPLLKGGGVSHSLAPCADLGFRFEVEHEARLHTSRNPRDFANRGRGIAHNRSKLVLSLLETA